MSRKKLAVAAGMLVVSCLTAMVYAQDSSESSLTGKLEQLRRSFLNPGPNESGNNWSQRESYSERHRQRISGNTEPSPRTASLPFAERLFSGKSSNDAQPSGGERILDETPQGVVERLKEEPSAELEAAMNAVPAAPVVHEGNASMPIYGIPRRIKPGSAQTASIPGAESNVPAADTTAVSPSEVQSPVQRSSLPATAQVPTHGLPGAVSDPSLAAEVDEELVQQRRELRSARRIFPESSVDGVPVVEQAVEPRLESGPTETATADQSSPESQSVEAATESNSGRDNVLFAHKSPILHVQTMGPRSTIVGREAVYKVGVQNLGSVAAEGVVVNVEIPAWAEITKMEPTRGATQTTSVDANASAVQWQVGSLNAQSQELLTLKLVPRKSQSFDLAVNWTFTPHKTEAMIEVREPKLQLALSGPNDVMFGETKIYRLTVTNPGTGPAENVEVRLLPIDGESEVAASQNIGMLAPGEERALEIELTARQAGAVTMRAYAVADGDLRADAAEQILVRRAELQLDVTGPQAKFASTPASYRLRLSNSGNATAEQVQAFAILPSGAKYTSASSNGQWDEATRRVEWKIGSLRADEERIVEVQCVLNNPGENALRVGTTAANELSDTANVVTQVEALADLRLEVMDPQGPVATGEESVYQVRIINRGTKSAKNIDVVAFFSEGIEPINVLGGPNDIGIGQVSFRPIASLPAGGEVQFKIIAKAEASGNHIFRAEVRCEEMGTRLAAEETTLYYDNGNATPISSTTVPLEQPSAATAAGVEPESLEARIADERSAGGLIPVQDDLGDRY